PPALPRYLVCDHGKLRQVLINLVGNALKFTAAGQVVLRLSYQDPQLTIEVEDTGPGIAPDELDDLFQPFSQTETGEQSQEGTGLGLSISKQFVHLLGGDIQARSTLGVGTTFTLSIPCPQGNPDQAAPPRTERFVHRLAPDQGTYRILVVEDKWSNRRFLVKLLESVGFEVREAENGKEGVRLFQEWEPHLIWMDMRMPVMSGYDAAKAIKATTQGQATVIVALTASVFEADKAIVLSAGCDDYLRKPVRQRDLFETMQRHLGVEFIWTESPAGHPPEGAKDLHLDEFNLDGYDADVISALADAAACADGELVLQIAEQFNDEALHIALAAKVRDFLFHEIIEAAEAAR
ncbi:MAG: ATP-binding protein, partial [Myxococcota bacterium]